ncbi:unnamed protein product [Linum trigynum]|uniref:Uncharacterized protein n=1 Tax=Linum trigynum TaxID=586398 RepID=A0AAV2E7W0_9ROSI
MATILALAVVFLCSLTATEGQGGQINTGVFIYDQPDCGEWKPCPKQPANPYTRPCLAINRCRTGNAGAMTSSADEIGDERHHDVVDQMGDDHEDNSIATVNEHAEKDDGKVRDNKRGRKLMRKSSK